jgi:hypothetical protein
MKANEIELIRALAEALALEFALVDDEDLSTIHEGIDLLTRARRCLECRGCQCPDPVVITVQRYRQHGRL